jgi:hypothetical protein
VHPSQLDIVAIARTNKEMTKPCATPFGEAPFLPGFFRSGSRHGHGISLNSILPLYPLSLGGVACRFSVAAIDLTGTTGAHGPILLGLIPWINSLMFTADLNLARSWRVVRRARPGVALGIPKLQVFAIQVPTIHVLHVDPFPDSEGIFRSKK